MLNAIRLLIYYKQTLPQTGNFYITKSLIFIEHKQLVRFTMLLKFRVWNKITNAIWDSVMNKITTVIFEYMHMSGIMSG